MASQGSWRANLISGPFGPPIPRREIVKLLERLRKTIDMTIDRLIVLVDDKPKSKTRRRRTAR